MPKFNSQLFMLLLIIIFSVNIFVNVEKRGYKQVAEIYRGTAIQSDVDADAKIYTLKLSNGYNTSLNHPMTLDLASRYIEHLNSCPIPLRMRTYEEYIDQYVSKVVEKYDKFDTIESFAGKNVVGQHVGGYPIPGWPNYFLFVAARENPHALMATYFHELGHYECNTNKCPHCKTHGYKGITEHHAILNEIESVIEYDFPQIMKVMFIRYNGWFLNYEDYEEYADAILTIQDSDLWKKVKEYAKEHNLVVPIFEKAKEKKGLEVIIVFPPRKN